MKTKKKPQPINPHDFQRRKTRGEQFLRYLTSSSYRHTLVWNLVAEFAPAGQARKLTDWLDRRLGCTDFVRQVILAPNADGELQLEIWTFHPLPTSTRLKDTPNELTHALAIPLSYARAGQTTREFVKALVDDLQTTLCPFLVPRNRHSQVIWTKGVLGLTLGQGEGLQALQANTSTTSITHDSLIDELLEAFQQGPFAVAFHPGGFSVGGMFYNAPTLPGR